MNGSSYEIIIDTDKVGEIKQNITKDMTELDSIIDNMTKLVTTEIPSNWQGDVSDAYVQSFTYYLEKIKKVNRFNSDLVDVMNKHMSEVTAKEEEFVSLSRW